MTTTSTPSDATTALYDMHLQAGARMVPFAGYQMPVQYRGIKAEHLHTRSRAGLFDVSHMGQLLVTGDQAIAELEALLPVDLDALSIDQQCYTFFPLPNGGVLDDLIINRRAERAFMLVVNAGRKAEVLDHLARHLPTSSVDYFSAQSLLALQGPRAEQALAAAFSPAADALSGLSFMHGVNLALSASTTDDDCFDGYISRSGYTGEDGFEISVPDANVTQIAAALLAQGDVEWVGLGARDSLRLEAGLCLYGHELNETISPIEAGLGWSIHRNRRLGGVKQGGFLGAEHILEQMGNKPARSRKGFIVKSKLPVREGAAIVDAGGEKIGQVSSGGYSPTLERPVLMAYVDNTERADTALAQQQCFAVVRQKMVPISETAMPFVPHRYRK